MGRLILSLFVLFSVSLKGQTVVSGLVSDSKTGEALFGATVFDHNSGRGGVTNAYGNFVFSSDKDSIHLQVSYIGYKTVILKALTSSIKNFEIHLIPSLDLDEVEIVGTKYRAPFQQEGIKMDRKFIEALPQFLGESDVLKAAQFLPGVQRSSELSAGMVVRGGSPDQNLILLDGIPVYNAYHLFGLFSVFSPQMVQNSYLLKGSFPARYGGRLSSVMDIQTREGSKEKFGGSVGIGPVTSHLFLEGPVDSLTTFAVSARRTFLDLIVSPVVYARSGGDATAILKFHDFNFKVNRRLNRRDRLYASAYFGKDKFGGRTHTASRKSTIWLGWGNEMAMLRWIRNYDSGVFFSLKGYYSSYRFFTGFKEEFGDEFAEFEYYSGIRDFAINADWETGGKSSMFRWGLKAVNHSFSPGIVQSASEGTGIENDISQGTKIDNQELTVYLEWEKSWSSKLKSNLGINGNALFNGSKNYVYPDPRLKLDYFLGANSHITGGFSQLTQYVHLLTNPAISLPTDLWLPSTADVKPGRSRELSFAYHLEKNDWKVEVGAYHRYLTNLIELKEGRTIFTTDENWADNVNVGKGEAYGMELSMQKTFNRWYFGSAIAISRSLRKVEGVSNNEWFPYKYDRPLYFSSYGGVDLTPNKKFSFAFNVSSGDRFTIAVGEFRMAPFGRINAPEGDSHVEYSGRNEFQMPMYARLDISYDVSKKKKRGESTWKYSILNVLNKHNPAFVDPFGTTKSNGNSISVKTYSVIPFFPSFKWTRTF